MKFIWLGDVYRNNLTIKTNIAEMYLKILKKEKKKKRNIVQILIIKITNVVDFRNENENL